MNIAIIGLGKFGKGLAGALENTVHNITRKVGLTQGGFPTPAISSRLTM